VMHSEHEWRSWRQPRIQWRRLFDRNLLGCLCVGFWRKVRRYRSRPGELLRALRAEVGTFNLPHLKTAFGDYNDPAESYDDPSSYSPKARAVAKLLGSVRPGRLLDLAANGGWFTGYAARLGHAALGVDIDPNAVDRALPRGREMEFDVALMNLIWPTPPQGEFLMYPSAYERFQADTVLMIAVHHHLNLRERVKFEALGAMARRYGAKNLIIEWIPKRDVIVQRWLKSRAIETLPDWYREGRFIDAFREYFPNVTRVPSGSGHRDFPEGAHRTMFLFQR
jgi:SAM-dependent methyltransferase